MLLRRGSLMLFALLLGYFVWAWIRRNKENFSDKDKKAVIGGCDNVLLPGVMLPLKALRRQFAWRIRGDRLEQLRKIYVGRGEEEIFFLHYGKMACLYSGVVMFCLLAVMAGSMVSQKGELINQYFLERDGVLGQERMVDLSAVMDEEEKEIAVRVPRKQYTDQELREKLREAKEYVDSRYLGENPSAEEVAFPLNLLAEIPGSAIEVNWKLDVDGVILKDGSIANEELEEAFPTEITAVFSYGEYEETEIKMLTVLPRRKSESELHWEEWQRRVEESEKKSATDTYIKLPDQAGGKEVRYKEKKMPVSHMVLGASLLFLMAAVLLQEEKLRKEIQYREKELRMDYPEFVEYFVLLVGAGLTVKGAWERIARDYEKGEKGKRYVYEEMLVSVREMENGMGEARAYELFGKRTGLLPYMKFCTLIVQNLKKGSDDLLKLLDYEVADAFRVRKENAKVLGEEAGTKLLLPMMLMLIIVFVLILYAAFYNL